MGAILSACPSRSKGRKECASGGSDSSGGVQSLGSMEEFVKKLEAAGPDDEDSDDDVPETVETELSTGRVIGDVSGSVLLGEVARFSGIPFAEAPVGTLRWRKPRPPTKWTGSLDCTARRPPEERWAWPMQGIGDHKGQGLRVIGAGDPMISGVYHKQDAVDGVLHYRHARSGAVIHFEDSQWRLSEKGSLNTFVYSRSRDKPEGKWVHTTEERNKIMVVEERGIYESEDCLLATVVSPLDALEKGAGQLPVLVSIYGGGLVGGSMYDKGQCCREYAPRDVVLVTFNYRVGVLGYLWPAGGDANCGCWDQVQALRWVQQEISAFGGDPNNVTIMGESAGADSCFWLCSSPAAKGLFGRALIQSPASFAITEPQAREMTAEFAAVAGLPSAALDRLQSLSAAEVLRCQLEGQFRCSHSCGPGWRLLTQLGGALPNHTPEPDPSAAGLFRHPAPGAGWTMPVVALDGEFMVEQPLDALARGAAAELEVVVGGNRDEDAFVPKSAEEPDQPARGSFGPRVRSMDEVCRRMAWEIAGMPGCLRETAEALRSRVEKLVAAYEVERSRDLYGLGPCGNADCPEQWLMDTMSSDMAFLTAVHLIAERLAVPGCSKKVYRYQFNGFGGKRATHGSEMEMVCGEDSVCGPVLRHGDADVRGHWIDSWAGFARSGDPNTDEVAGWLPYTRDDRAAGFWDGLTGFSVDEKRVLAGRDGLLATAALWEELWALRSPVA